jgi:uncharacterized RDD family membrane protein YckC
VLGLYLPVYLYIFRSATIVKQALASSLLSAAAPIRLAAFLPPDRFKAAGELVVAHVLVVSFILLEGMMIFCREDRRRIIDLLAGTQVVDARSLDCKNVS